MVQFATKTWFTDSFYPSQTTAHFMKMSTHFHFCTDTWQNLAEKEREKEKYNKAEHTLMRVATMKWFLYLFFVEFCLEFFFHFLFVDELTFGNELSKTTIIMHIHKNSIQLSRWNKSSRKQTIGMHQKWRVLDIHNIRCNFHPSFNHADHFQSHFLNISDGKSHKN